MDMIYHIIRDNNPEWQRHSASRSLSWVLPFLYSCLSIAIPHVMGHVWTFGLLGSICIIAYLNGVDVLVQLVDIGCSQDNAVDTFILQTPSCARQSIWHLPRQWTKMRRLLFLLDIGLCVYRRPTADGALATARCNQETFVVKVGYT